MSGVVIVLVHGGAHGAWCWERLPPHLTHPALAVDGRSLDTIPLALRLLTSRAMRRAQEGAPVRRRMPERMVRRMLCNDMDEKTTRYVTERLVPEAVGLVVERVSRASLPPSTERTYVKLLRDRSISPRRQDRMIANLGGADVVTIDAGHDGMISRPRDVAAVLDEIARRAAAAV